MVNDNECSSVDSSYIYKIKNILFEADGVVV
jgi:hypothetical protein